MGPIEASMRERVIEARRNLSRGVNPPIRWSAPLPPPIRTVMPKPREFEPGEVLVVTSMEEVPSTPALSTHAIIEDVCTKFGVLAREVLSPMRSQRLIKPRDEAIYRIRNERMLSWCQMGRIFGRDHSSVIMAYRRYVERNPEMVQ